MRVRFACAEKLPELSTDMKGQMVELAETIAGAQTTLERLASASLSEGQQEMQRVQDDMKQVAQILNLAKGQLSEDERQRMIKEKDDIERQIKARETKKPKPKPTEPETDETPI